jgi:6-phospho-beta-glucosidase
MGLFWQSFFRYSTKWAGLFNNNFASEGGYLEGGKGLSIMDVMTAGSKDKKRVITDGIVDGVFYPNHDGNKFYYHYKEDILIW